MLQTINTSVQTVATGQDISFDANMIQTGIVATHVPGATAIALNRPGFYQVTFSADAFGTGVVRYQLMQNGQAIAGAQASITSAGDVENVGIASWIVQVCPCCQAYHNSTTITIRNAGVESTLNTARVSVTKIA